MTVLKPIYFNGKFYAGGMNGVHRVSDRLIREVDALLAGLPPADRPTAKLLLPASRGFEPRLSAIEAIEQEPGDTQYWEQQLLPRRAADGVLVNLANLAPLRHRRKILLIHDAQFLFPDSGYPLRQRAGYRLLVPRMARSSAAVLTVSGYSRQMLDLFGISPRARTGLLYNGCDHIHEQPADPACIGRLGLSTIPYALLFGSAKAYKNIKVIFDAFSGSAMAPLRLVVVGADRAGLERAGLRPPHDAIWVGKIDDPGLRALYEAAFATVFPSRTEGFGLPPLEAMLCGCPVVVAPAGAIPEVCRDSVLYADVDDPSSWQDALLRLLDPAIRAAKMQAGQARALDFTWSRAGRRLLDVILEQAA